MTELQADYSGAFDPDFSYEKLARETLLKLLQAAADYIRRIDGQWYMTVMEECGDSVAFGCDARIWQKLARHTMEITTNLLNIHGDDVVTVMKALQASPWTLTYACDIDVKNNDHAIITYLNCPTLLALEKEGLGREMLICSELEVKLMEIKAHYFNPNIVVTPLKLPPREPNSEICCQWELKLDRR